MIKTANKVSAANKAKMVNIVTKDQLPIKLKNIKFKVKGIHMEIMNIKSNSKEIKMPRNTTTNMSLKVEKDNMVNKNNAKDSNGKVKDNIK